MTITLNCFDCQASLKIDLFKIFTKKDDCKLGLLKEEPLFANLTQISVVAVIWLIADAAHLASLLSANLPANIPPPVLTQGRGEASTEACGADRPWDMTLDIDALRMAWLKHHPGKQAGLIFHSDLAASTPVRISGTCSRNMGLPRR